MRKSMNIPNIFGLPDMNHKVEHLICRDTSAPKTYRLAFAEINPPLPIGVSWDGPPPVQNETAFNYLRRAGAPCAALDFCVAWSMASYGTAFIIQGALTNEKSSAGSQNMQENLARWMQKDGFVAAAILADELVALPPRDAGTHPPAKLYTPRPGPGVLASRGASSATSTSRAAAARAAAPGGVPPNATLDTWSYATARTMLHMAYPQKIYVGQLTDSDVLAQLLEWSTSDFVESRGGGLMLVPSDADAANMRRNPANKLMRLMIPGLEDVPLKNPAPGYRTLADISIRADYVIRQQQSTGKYRVEFTESEPPLPLGPTWEGPPPVVGEALFEYLRRPEVPQAAVDICVAWRLACFASMFAMIHRKQTTAGADTESRVDTAMSAMRWLRQGGAAMVATFADELGSLGPPPAKFLERAGEKGGSTADAEEIHGRMRGDICATMALIEALESGRGFEALREARDAWKQEKAERTCAVCNKTAAEAGAEKALRCCGACGEQFYCSRECQVLDWKQRHKKECRGKKKIPGLRERGSGKAVLYTDSTTGETRAVSAGALERARRLEQLEAQDRRTAPRERRGQPGEAVALHAILWLVGQLVRLVKAAAAAVAGVWSGASAGGAPAGGGTCERAAAGGGTRTNHGGPSTRAGGRR